MSQEMSQWRPPTAIDGAENALRATCRYCRGMRYCDHWERTNFGEILAECQAVSRDGRVCIDYLPTLDALVMNPG